MKERILAQRRKANATPISIPTLSQPKRGFGLQSSEASSPALTQVQLKSQPLAHDISRISLRPQAKLTVSQPNDVYEQEADRVAQQVMQNTSQPVNQQSIQREAEPVEEEDDEQVQAKSLTNSITPLLQREAEPVEEEDDEQVQAKSAGTGMEASSNLESSIQQARGGGQQLSDNVRQPMEQAFGYDFTGVKIHNDFRSDQMNQSIQARAFTTGQDIFFRQGEYTPESNTGKELLAHELTHVVQQNH